MEGVIVKMTAKKQISLKDVFEKINSIHDVEQISKDEQIINDVAIWTLTYVKYYNASFCGMHVVLTEHGQDQTAHVAVCGGIGDIFNSRNKGNRKLAKECIQKLEDCGFLVMKSTLDMKKTLNLDLFLK